jgi:hypothetical protein
MENFEDVRAWALSSYKLKDNEPFLLSFDVAIPGDAAKTVLNRRQGIYIAELDCEDGGKVARISTPIARTARVNSERCMRFNWAQRLGYLAFGDLDGAEWLHLCENRPYPGLSAAEMRRIVAELAPLADKLEHAYSSEDRV